MQLSRKSNETLRRILPNILTVSKVNTIVAITPEESKVEKTVGQRIPESPTNLDIEQAQKFAFLEDS